MRKKEENLTHVDINDIKDTNNPTVVKNNQNVQQQNDTAVSAVINYEPLTTEETNPMKIIQQSNENLVRMGVVIADTRIEKGQLRKDKDGKPKLDANDKPTFYDDKYYVTVSVRGGEFETEVEPHLYSTVAIGGTYRAQGRYAAVTNYGKTELKPVFNRFIELISPECED